MKKLAPKERIGITALFTIAIIVVLLWEYKHGGVATHYILNSDEMPGFSNWWGLISIPVFAWIVSGWIRLKAVKDSKSAKPKLLLRAISLMILGLIISFVFIKYPESDIPFYITLVLAMLSFFVPVYKAECLLGYVLGSLFVFGAFIPVIAGCVLWLVFWIFYKTPRKIISLLGSTNRPTES